MNNENFPTKHSSALSLTFRSHKRASSKSILKERPLKQWHPTFKNFCVSNFSVLLHTTKLSSLQNLRFLNPKLGKLNKVLRFAQKKQECFLLRRQLASERYYLIYFSARFPYKGLLNYAHSYLIKEENNETNRLPLGLRFCFLMVGGSTQKQKRKSFLWLWTEGCNKLLKGREVGIWILKNKFWPFTVFWGYTLIQHDTRHALSVQSHRYTYIYFYNKGGPVAISQTNKHARKYTLRAIKSTLRV